MNKKIAFFDTKPYDKKSFIEINKDFGFDITYFEVHLNAQTAALSGNFAGVCAFVNDTIDQAVIDHLVKRSVQILGLRCAGYNNVDFKAAYNKIHIVRVPDYSPYAVAEHAAALILSLNRKTHKAYYRTRDGNFSINGLLGFDMHGKTAGIIGTGKIGSAGLDVYEEESDYFFEDKSTELITDDTLARLLTFPNVLITSHQAFFTHEAIHNIAHTTLSNFKEFFDGGYLKNEICYKCEKPCLKKQDKRCF